MSLEKLRMESKENIMYSGKCISKLCPLSFGLALGLACGLVVFIGSLWVMHFGLTPMMEQYHLTVPTYNDAIIYSLWALLKGFIFGFFVALFYDFFACCIHRCKKTGCGNPSCTCACACCKGGTVENKEIK